MRLKATAFLPFPCVYLYDMQENKLTHLENYTYRPRLSPDMKYLAYTSNFGGSIGYDIGEISPTGFYIKNLEDGTTLFFEHDDYFHRAIF